MGEEGFARVPVGPVQAFLDETSTSKDADGYVRQYHLLISPPPDAEVYYAAGVMRIDLSDYVTPF